MNAQTQPTQGLEWADLDEFPILLANHFLVQYEPDEFVVTLGQATALGEAPVSTLARISLNRNRLTELIALLQASLDEHDRER